MLEFTVADIKDVVVANGLDAVYNFEDYKRKIDIIFFGGL